MRYYNCYGNFVSSCTAGKPEIRAAGSVKGNATVKALLLR